jgi:hypothetical protein
MHRTILGAATVLAISGASSATTYYADAVAGSDAAPGTLAQPFQTLGKCLAALQSAGDVCDLRAGTYSAVTTDPGSMPSGVVGNPIMVQGHGNEHVVIRQGSSLAWTKVSGNLWKASFDYNAVVNAQVAQTAASASNYFERGVRLWNDAIPLPEASFPNLSAGANSFHSVLTAESNSGTNLIKNSQIPATWNLTGARVVVSAREHLTMHSIPITSSSAGQVNFVGDVPWSTAAGTWFYLEGGKDLIDTAWEWAADGANKLIYLQTDGSDPNQLPIRVQTSSVAFFLKNLSSWSIHDLEFQGVVPVPSGTVNRIEYHHLTIHEAGLLRFNDKLWDYTQVAGIVLGDDSRFHHSVVDGCDGRYVDMKGARDTVENNIFHNGGRLGQFEGTVSVIKADAIVARNDIYYSGYDGVATMTTSANNLQVRRNWIKGAGRIGSDAAGIRVSTHATTTVVLDSNLVSGTLQGAAPNVSGSIGGSGIILDDASTNNNVLHNIFTDLGTGVVLSGDDSYRIYSSLNNLIGNNTGVDIGSFANMRMIGDLTGTLLDDNILSGPLTTSVVTIAYPVTGIQAKVADLQGLHLEYRGNLSVGQDPLLTDPVHFDFSLQAGSPAIDLGVVYINGQSFLGTAPDAGAIEAGGKPWVFGLYDDTVANACNPALCFENPSLWTPSWNGPDMVRSTSLADHVEGAAAMSAIPNNYVALETPNLDQTVAKGFNMLQISMKFSTMINPWYYGAVQFYLECPSLGVYNQYVGQFDLTGLPLGTWNTEVMIIPSSLGSQLAGKTFTDLKVRMAVNIPAGSGAVLFDDLRLLP